MSDSKIVGYKKIFGLILPDWISEKMLRVFVVSVLSVFVMLLLSIFYVRPLFDEIKTLEATLSSEQKDLDSLSKSKSGIDKLQTDLTEADKIKILAAIPSTYSPDRAIYILREIANLTGVSIVSYSLPSGVLLDTNKSDVKDTKTNEIVVFSSYPLKIVVSAPVEVLLTFINKIETSLPFGVVSDFNLQEVTKLANRVQNKNVQIEMELKYYQASLGSINLNKIQAMTDKNLETSNLLSGFDLIDIKDESVALILETNISTSSADMFGL